MSRRKLTRDEVLTLRGFKGQTNAQQKFFDYLRKIYEGDDAVLKDIEQMEAMQLSINTVNFPAARSKTQTMFYEYMDDFNSSIGYTGEDTDEK